MLDSLELKQSIYQNNYREKLVADARALYSKLISTHNPLHYDEKHAFYHFEWFQDCIEDGEFPQYIVKESWLTECDHYPVAAEVTKKDDPVDYDYYMCASTTSWRYDCDHEHKLSISVAVDEWDSRFEEWKDEAVYISKSIRCDQDIKDQLDAWSLEDKESFTSETMIGAYLYYIHWMGYYIDWYESNKIEQPLLNDDAYYPLFISKQITTRDEVFEKVEEYYGYVKDQFKHLLKKDPHV